MRVSMLVGLVLLATTVAYGKPVQENDGLESRMDKRSSDIDKYFTYPPGLHPGDDGIHEISEDFDPQPFIDAALTSHSEGKREAQFSGGMDPNQFMNNTQVPFGGGGMPNPGEMMGNGGPGSICNSFSGSNSNGGSGSSSSSKREAQFPGGMDPNQFMNNTQVPFGGGGMPNPGDMMGNGGPGQICNSFSGGNANGGSSSSSSSKREAQFPGGMDPNQFMNNTQVPFGGGNMPNPMGNGGPGSICNSFSGSNGNGGSSSSSSSKREAQFPGGMDPNQFMNNTQVPFGGGNMPNPMGNGGPGSICNSFSGSNSNGGSGSSSSSKREAQFPGGMDPNQFMNNTQVPFGGGNMPNPMGNGGPGSICNSFSGGNGNGGSSSSSSSKREAQFPGGMDPNQFMNNTQVPFGGGGMPNPGEMMGNGGPGQICNSFSGSNSNGGSGSSSSSKREAQFPGGMDPNQFMNNTQVPFGGGGMPNPGEMMGNGGPGSICNSFSGSNSNGGSSSSSS